MEAFIRRGVDIMSDQIYLEPALLDEQVMNAEKLIKTLQELVPEAKNLSFGAGGSCGSTGPCANAMVTFTEELANTIQQMAETMRQLIGFIRSGAENIEDMDKFLAGTTATIGTNTEPK
jgi:hypothetical protein